MQTVRPIILVILIMKLLVFGQDRPSIHQIQLEYYNNNYSDTLSAGRNIGNPDLEAESSINYEIGIDVKNLRKVSN